MIVHVPELIDEVLGLPPGTTQSGDTVDDIDEWDSLGQVELVVRIESLVGERLKPDEIARLDGVAAIERALKSRGVSLRP